MVQDWTSRPVCRHHTTDAECLASPWRVWQLTIGFVFVLVVVLGGGMFAPGARYTLRGTVKVATGDRIGRGVGVSGLRFMVA